MRRGHALVEVLVASALGLLTLILLVNLFVPLSQLSRRTMEEMDVAQAARSIYQRLATDLQTAPARAIHYPSPGPVSFFAIQSVDSVTTSGRAGFADQLIVYSLDLPSGRLVRAICKPSDLTVDFPASFSGDQLRNFASSSGTVRRTLVRGMLKEFRLDSIGNGRQGIKQLHLLLKSTGKEFALDESIALRNTDL